MQTATIVARILKQGVTRMSDLYVTMYKHARLVGCVGMLSKEIRCCEIASEAILGQKHSCSSYIARRVLHPIFDCPCMHLLSQLTSNFHDRRY